LDTSSAPFPGPAPCARPGGLFYRAAIAGIVVAACSEPPAAPVITTPEPVSHPAFTITSPERGDMLQQGGLGPDSVAIVGTVCDPLYPITSLTFNGTAVPVSGTDLCQSFDVKRESRWGLTIIDGEARNSRGTVTRLTQSFLRGPDYFPAAADNVPTARVPNALFVQLDQAVIDDNDRNTPDDIATLLSAAFTGANWNASIPNPLTASPDANRDGNIDTATYDCVLYTQTNRQTGYRITRGTLAHGAVSIGSSVVADTGLETTVTLANLTIPVSIFGSLDLGCLGETDATVSGTLTANSVTITSKIAITSSGGAPNVDIKTLTIQTAGTSVNVDFTGLSIIDNLISSITTFLTNYLPNSLIGQFAISLVKPQLSSIVSGLVPTFDESVSPRLRFIAAADTFAFPGDSAKIGSAVQALPDVVRSGSPPQRGPLERGGAPPGFAGTAFDFGLGLKDDFVNQALWAAWDAGAFDLTATSVLGCDAAVPGGDVSFASLAELPPVLMPAVGGGQDSVSLGIGDMRFTGTLSQSAVGGTGGPLQLTVYASGIATGAFETTPQGGLTLGIGAAPQADFQITAIDDSSALPAVRSALAPWFACVVDQLAQTAVQHLPQPEFALPGGVLWRVGNAVVARESGYTTLRGEVQTN
jgi:hypothetical protein